MEESQRLKESQQQVGGLHLSQGCSEGLTPDDVTKFLLHMPNDSVKNVKNIFQEILFNAVSFALVLGPCRLVCRWLTAHLTIWIETKMDRS